MAVFFAYSFLVQTLIVGLLLSICAALAGVPIVLKKNSMIGDGLSHVGFGAVAIATVLGLAPLEFAIPAVIIASFFILKLEDNHKISGDSAIAIISASALALGTFLISITKGVNIDLNSYLFGNILSINNTDIIFSIILTAIILTIYLISYNKIFTLTFDEKFAKSIGVKTDFYRVLFAILCSIIVVLGMRLMGTLLISSLLIFPTLSAMQLFKKFKTVVIFSVLISALTFTLGLFISYICATPTSSTIVLSNLVTFLLVKIINLMLK